MLRLRLGAVLALLCLVPVQSAGAQDAPLVANPALPTIPLTLAAGGENHKYTVEMACSTTEQARGLILRKTMARGLILRKTMARDRGMTFPLAVPREAAFWMEGTYLPLDTSSSRRT